MESKNKYLIWREKNDFFTALNKDGSITTWSTATGDLLYKQEAQQFKNPLGNPIDVKDYEIYRANIKDES